EAAKKDSVDTLLEAADLKTEGRAQAVVAVGCMVERHRSELEQALPEVDLFLGASEMDRLVPALVDRGLLDDAPVPHPGVRLFSGELPHMRYLKISEGCDHGCAFCAIPLMRGKHRSTPIDALVREAQTLADAGVVELNVISQDTTWYGRDLLRGTAPAEGDLFVGRTFAAMPNVGSASARASARGSLVEAATPRPRPGSVPSAAVPATRRGLLPELLTALLAETSIPWLRLFYMYPSGISRELVETIAREPRIVSYLDMPIQHGADAVLTRMRRPERQATIRERVAWLRDSIPDLSLRTTLIVGFPGETEDDFEQMLELLEEIRFDHLGAFPYSREESTPAATMSDAVPDAVTRERLERLLELQRSITLERNERWLGRETIVLLDRLVGRESDMAAASERGAVGRTVGQALEIDGVVHITDAGDAQSGDFVRARIVEALDDDLVATVIGTGEEAA
ncbi:MAG: MiaB/RimO family radical SAM methylthiotransferase, partial [Longimicrobiales bacterium]